MKLNKNILTSILIFLAAFSIRIYYIKNTIAYPELGGDALSYFWYGINIHEFGVFSNQPYGEQPLIPNSYRAPGFPFVIALVAKLTAPENIVQSVIYTQIVASSLTACLIFLTGRNYMPFWGATIAALLFAINPHNITIVNELVTETFFSFLLLFSLYFFCRLSRTGSTFDYWVSGFGFGLTYMVNPIIFFLPILLAIQKVFFAFKDDIKPKLNKITVFLFVFLILPCMWSFRNTTSVPSNAQTSEKRLFENFVIGSHPNYYEIWLANPRDPTNPADLDIARTNYDWGSYLKVWSQRILDEPLKYAKWYLVDKPKLFWNWKIMIGFREIYVYIVKTSPYMTSGLMLLSFVFMKATHAWILMFAVAGLFVPLLKTFKYNKDFYFTIYTTLIYISLVYVILQSEGRYSIPLRPELYLAAIFFIHTLTDWYKQKQSSTLMEQS